MVVNDRIELLISKLGYNPHSFTKTLGIKSTSTIPNFLRDHSRKPSYEILNRIISRFPTVNANWLLTGDGDMILRDSNDLPAIKDRIKSIMKFYRFDEGDIIKKCGLHPATLKKVLNGSEEPDEETLLLIQRGFPNISEDWFYRNQGRMFSDFAYKSTTSGEPDTTGIPLYRDTFTKQLKGKPEGVLQISGYEDCEMAAYVSMKSMEPVIHQGDIIIMKSASRDMLLYGQTYIINQKTDHFLQVIKKGPSTDEISLVSPPGNELDPIIIRKQDITSLFLVKGYIRRTW